MSQKLRKAYTLVELMMVTSIIGVMASITVPSLQGFQDDAKMIKANAEVKTLQSIVERYQRQTGQLPPTLETTKFTENINITQQPIYDPFSAPHTPYQITSGQTNSNKEYYVIYSAGRNNKTEFIIQDKAVVCSGDDIVASNLPVVR